MALYSDYASMISLCENAGRLRHGKKKVVCQAVCVAGVAWIASIGGLV